jgi:hypothetical protein
VVQQLSIAERRRTGGVTEARHICPSVGRADRRASGDHDCVCELAQPMRDADRASWQIYRIVENVISHDSAEISIDKNRCTKDRV